LSFQQRKEFFKYERDPWNIGPHARREIWARVVECGSIPTRQDRCRERICCALGSGVEGRPGTSRSSNSRDQTERPEWKAVEAVQIFQSSPVSIGRHDARQDANEQELGRVQDPLRRSERLIQHMGECSARFIRRGPERPNSSVERALGISTGDRAGFASDFVYKKPGIVHAATCPMGWNWQSPTVRVVR